jgi:hypothetical protein
MCRKWPPPLHTSQTVEHSAVQVAFSEARVKVETNGKEVKGSVEATIGGKK